MPKTPGLLDLVALLPAGDIAKAAKAVGLTPEALARGLGTLESTLGTGLLANAAKALKPAEAGRLVLDHAARVFSQAREFTRDLEELAGLQSPELVFGIDGHVAELAVGTALGRMVTANSRLRVRSTVADFDELARSVTSGQLEFALADTSAAERHAAKLTVEPVADRRLHFYARAGHPLVAQAAPSLETILVFPLATQRIPSRIAVHLLHVKSVGRRDRESGDLSPSITTDSHSVSRSAVIAGDAVGLAPLAAIDSDVRAKRVALVAFEAPWLQTSYGVFHSRKRTLSRVAQLFVSQLRQAETAMRVRERSAPSRLRARRSGGRLAGKMRSRGK